MSPTLPFSPIPSLGWETWAVITITPWWMFSTPSSASSFITFWWSDSQIKASPSSTPHPYLGSLICSHAEWPPLRFLTTNLLLSDPTMCPGPITQPLSHMVMSHLAFSPQTFPFLLSIPDLASYLLQKQSHRRLTSIALRPSTLPSLLLWWRSYPGSQPRPTLYLRPGFHSTQGHHSQ